MTLREAMSRFLEAANNSIYQSDAVLQAWADLKALGVIDGELELCAKLRYAETAPANQDAEFLSKLRITPDLEVRE